MILSNCPNCRREFESLAPCLLPGVLESMEQG